MPVWQLLSAMSPAEIVALVDFRYLTDGLTPGEALELLERAAPGRREREAELRDGYPADTTSVGWLGCDDRNCLNTIRLWTCSPVATRMGATAPCRLGGVNEVVAVLLLAAKFGVTVCPHAGGVGLCELVQRLSAFDYIAVSGRLDGRMIEYVDHLHEHFVDPVVIVDGRYRLPSAPGYSAQMHPASLARYGYPDGSAWS